MSMFKKTNAKIFSKPSLKVTPDTNYWKKLGTPIILKEFGPIDYIHFSSVEPHFFAITCSVRVQIYNPFTKSVHKTLTKFKECAYGAKLRLDGSLAVAGGEEALVKLFDVHSKSLLRVFKGHTNAVHRCDFTLDQTRLISFSDDKTSKLWDIPGESVVNTFESHDDYIRAGAVSPISPYIFMTGSYDRKLRMFDSRTSNEPVYTADHGAPVESVLFLPTGGIFISAGGTELRVWDAMAGGKFLVKLCNHHKTVTSLCLGSNGSRLFSASLDKHVKIYDISSYKVVHNIDFPSPILSVGLSSNDETLAVGMVDGLVSISKRENEIGKVIEPPKKRTSYQYSSDRIQSTVDSIVQFKDKDVQSKHDVFLRKFQYSKALDSVLVPYIMNKNPSVTVSVMQELIRRKGFHNALHKRRGKSLGMLIRFLIRYIGDHRFTPILIDVANILIEVHEGKTDSSDFQTELWSRLMQRLQEEIELTLKIGELSGIVEMLQTSAQIQPEVAPSTSFPLHPSLPSSSHNITLTI